MTFRGVLPVLQTPFHEDESLDLESLAREVEDVARAGASGVVFPGFASEWWKLGEEEIFAAAEVIARRRGPTLKAVFNVTAQSTRRAAEQARRFAALGADGLMCLPPFVVQPDAAGLAAHLRAVLAAAEVPHAIQYAASLTGTQLGAELIRGLRREFPHLAAVKVDFIPTGPAITALREALADDAVAFVVGFAGVQLLDAIPRGARGLMGAAGHAAEDVRVFRALLEDGAGAGELYRRWLPLVNLEMQTLELSIAVNKRLLAWRGVIVSDRLRAPGRQLDHFHDAQLRSQIESLREFITRGKQCG